MMDGMRKPPPVSAGGSMPAERLDLAFRKVVTFSKEDLLKEQAKLKRSQEKRREKRALGNPVLSLVSKYPA